MRSADHLKVLAYLFGVASLVCFLAASGLYYFFSRQAVENKRLQNEVAGLTKKVDGLINEREVLMARLVISGKEPGIVLQPTLLETPITASIAESVTSGKEIKEVAQNIYDEFKDSKLNEDMIWFREIAYERNLNEIKRILNQLNISYDVWSSERFYHE